MATTPWRCYHYVYEKGGERDEYITVFFSKFYRALYNLFTVKHRAIE